MPLSTITDAEAAHFIKAALILSPLLLAAIIYAGEKSIRYINKKGR